MQSTIYINAQKWMLELTTPKPIVQRLFSSHSFIYWENPHMDLKFLHPPPSLRDPTVRGLDKILRPVCEFYKKKQTIRCKNRLEVDLGRKKNLQVMVEK